MAKRRSESKVFFPWERRRGVLGTLARARVRQIFVVLAVLAFVILLRMREENAAAVRSTRATITTAGHSVDDYRADHSGECPKGLGDVVASGYAASVPIDAWGRPLRLVCPGRRDTHGFDISSDGPDGVAGGLDRVE